MSDAYQLLRGQIVGIREATGFQPRPVAPELLEEIVAAASSSPLTGFNDPPGRFVAVVGDERELLLTRVAEALARHWGLGGFGPRGLGSDRVLQAPALLLAFSSLPTSEGLEAFAVVTSAVENVILLVHAAGMAAHRIYSAQVVPEAVLDFVGERLGHEIRRGELVAMIAVGYPLDDEEGPRSVVPVRPARLRWMGRTDGGPEMEPPGPISSPVVLEAARPGAGLRAVRGARVCVVDTYPYNRDQLAAWLGAAGYEVSTHERGGDVMAWVEEHGEPDLYILPETLPDTTGFELARRLRGAAAARAGAAAATATPTATRQPPIVVSTGRRDTAFRIAGLSAGVDYYLRKPVHAMELFTVTRMLLERHRLLDELRGANQELGRLVGELRAAQARLVQQAKMASLGQLVAGVAHEINTPLGAVVSNNDLFVRAFKRLRAALDEAGVAVPERVTQNLDAVCALSEVTRAACERITGIVRTLRNFARLDEAELKSVDLHDGLESTLVLIAHLLKDNKSISVERRYGRLPPVECHPNQINQVFMNLLVNACQAIEREGRIVIETGVETSGDDGGEQRAVVAITDTGKGIPPEHLPRIFDPGFTTKGAGVGTGLGLSICYQIVEAHHGDIAVASTPGQGTTFRMVLPLRDHT